MECTRATQSWMALFHASLNVISAFYIVFVDEIPDVSIQSCHMWPQLGCHAFFFFPEKQAVVDDVCGKPRCLEDGLNCSRWHRKSSVHTNFVWPWSMHVSTTRSDCLLSNCKRVRTCSKTYFVAHCLTWYACPVPPTLLLNVQSPSGKL